MAERLYTATEIGNMLGVGRGWVVEHSRLGSAPPVDYEWMKNGKPMPLWAGGSLDYWRAYHASGQSLPRADRLINYSDHKAVNQMASVTVTWKLWWRCEYDGGTVWWFSTPVGWWTSDDDGRRWKPTEMMVRPSDFRYQSVNGSANPRGAVSAVLREAGKLRRWIEKGIEETASRDNTVDMSA